MKHVVFALILILAAAAGATGVEDIDDSVLNLADVFQLEYADDPQISPDGTRIVYVRSFMDIISPSVRASSSPRSLIF